MKKFVRQLRGNGFQTLWVATGLSVYPEGANLVPVLITCPTNQAIESAGNLFQEDLAARKTPLGKGDLLVQFHGGATITSLRRPYGDIFGLGQDECCTARIWASSEVRKNKRTLIERVLNLSYLGVEAKDGITVKFTDSAFAGGFLTRHLQCHEKEVLIILGRNTSCCVYSTLVQGLQNGFKPIVVTDLLRDSSLAFEDNGDSDKHERILRQKLGHRAELVSFVRSNEFLAALQNKTAETYVPTVRSCNTERKLSLPSSALS